MTQANLFDARARQPQMQAEDVAILVRCLQGQGWVTAKQLTARHGISDRELRAIASVSEGRILGGQLGYCLIEEATVQQAQHSADFLKAQAKKMLTRAYEIEQALHRRQRAA